jgi:hypothetical protein
MSGLLLTDLLTEWTDAGCGASSYYTPAFNRRPAHGDYSPNLRESCRPILNHSKK